MDEKLGNLITLKSLKQIRFQSSRYILGQVTPSKLSVAQIEHIGVTHFMWLRELNSHQAKLYVTLLFDYT